MGNHCPSHPHTFISLHLLPHDTLHPASFRHTYLVFPNPLLGPPAFEINLYYNLDYKVTNGMLTCMEVRKASNPAM